MIIVHGYLCPRDFMRPLQWRISRLGLHVHLSDLLPLCIQEIERLAERLRITVEKVLAHEDATRCQMVGVSQGGMVAMTYLQRLGGADSVARLVTVGTPWQGSEMARFARPLSIVLPSIRQLGPDSPLLATLREKGVPEGVDLHSIALESDFISPPKQCSFPGAECVSVRSTGFSGGHQGLVLNRRIFAEVSEWLMRPLPDPARIPLARTGT